MKAKWWKVLLAMILCPAAMYMLSQSMEKRYTATMRLLVANSTRSADFPTPYSTIDDIVQFAGPRSAQSQVDVLTGSNVLIDAIQRTAKKWPNSFAGSNLGDQYSDLVKRLAFDTSQFSDVITLRVTMDDPRIAADTANNIGLAFIDYNEKMAKESGNSALRAIEASIEPVKKRLAEIDGELSKVKSEAGVSDYTTDVSAGANTRANLDQRLSDLKAQWEGAKAELASSEAALGKMGTEINASSTTQSNPVLQQIDVDLAKLESQHAGLLERFLPDAEQVRDVASQISQLKEKRRSMKEMIDAQKTVQINPNRSTMELTVAGIRAKEQSLGNQVTKLESEVGKWDEVQKKYPDLDKKIRGLERERTIAENNFQQLQQRLDLVQATGSGRQSGARIVSTAIPPINSPSFPDTRLFLFFGFGLGVVISAFILMPKGDVDIYGEVRPQRAGMGGRRGAAVAGRNLPAKPKAPADAPPPGDDTPPPSSG